jgi:hypothetical protein
MMKFGTARRRKNRASALRIRVLGTNLDPSSHSRIIGKTRTTMGSNTMALIHKGKRCSSSK